MKLVTFLFSVLILQFYLSISSMNAGTVYGGLEFPKLTFSDNVNLRAGNNKISLLSVAVGLPVSFLAFLISKRFLQHF